MKAAPTRSPNEELIATIVQEVLARLPVPATPLARREPSGRDGVFATVDEAVGAAREARKRLAALGLDERGRIVAVIRRLCEAHAEEWGKAEMEETKIGRLDHKIEKLKLVKRVLGVEVMRTEARTDVDGYCLIESSPWGVVAMALPATHSAPTLASNAINVLAAGNAAVFSPHPAGARIAARAVQAFNRAIEKETGLCDAICTVEAPSIESTQELFRHPDVALICVTGGPAVVRVAMATGKRVIAAGPGNPPVLVDPCADLDQAARDIVAGASFDNNLLCIGEKEVFVVERAAAEFMEAMKRARAVLLDERQIEALTRAAFTFDEKAGKRRPHVRGELVGRDPGVLAEAAGFRVPDGTELLFGETAEDHPFVQEEQMMPFLPVVRVRSSEAGIDAARRAEHGYRHTALIHSRKLENVTEMARALNTTLFVHNAPCSAALGLGGPGYLSYSIATPTGEGVTTPLTFTRQRQITLRGPLRIF
jgi:aldehyde dehydrogenase